MVEIKKDVLIIPGIEESIVHAMHNVIMGKEPDQNVFAGAEENHSVATFQSINYYHITINEKPR